MPEVFRIDGYSIYFTALDGAHGVHVHVRRSAKLDLARLVLQSDGSIMISHNKGRIPSREIKKIQAFCELYRDDILSNWIRMFGSEYHFDK